MPFKEFLGLWLAMIFMRIQNSPIALQLLKNLATGKRTSNLKSVRQIHWEADMKLHAKKNNCLAVLIVLWIYSLSTARPINI